MTPLFFITSLLLNITPGASVIYITTRTLSGTLATGIASAIGIVIGGIFHIVLSASGLSIILLNAPNAIQLIKLLGGVYLIYLGLQQLKPQNIDLTIKKSRLDKNVVWQGILVEILNPKIFVFFVAFLPQFIPNDHSNPLVYLTMLGVIYYTMGTGVNILYAVIAHYTKGKLLTHTKTKYYSIITFLALTTIGTISIVSAIYSGK